MDSAAFLRAIADHPDDDGPRLVYADALDERGDPIGEFIRLQCESAQMEEGGEPCEIDPHEGHTCSESPCPICASVERYTRLKRREADLLRENRDRWPNQFWFATGGTDLRVDAIYRPAGPNDRRAIYYRRGFIDTLCCSVTDWLDCGQAVSYVEPVVSEILVPGLYADDYGHGFVWHRCETRDRRPYWPHSYLPGLIYDRPEISEMTTLHGQFARWPVMFDSNLAALQAVSRALIGWSRSRLLEIRRELNRFDIRHPVAR